MGALKDGLGGGTGLSGIEESQDNDVVVTSSARIYFRDAGLNVYSSADGQLDIVSDTTVALSGAVTADSTLAVTGAITGPRGFVTKASGNQTVTVAQSGTVFLATASSGTQTFTLPDPAAGLIYTFICGHADGEILIDPQSGDSITVTAFAAVGADADTAIVAPAAGTGIKNTAASNAVGDSITLVSDGTDWFGVGIASGIWASQ